MSAPPIESPLTHRADTSRLVTRPFVMVTAATAAFFVYVGVLVPLIPRFIEDELGGGEFGIGLSVATFAFAAIAVRPVITTLIRGVGRRSVMVGGALIAAVAGAVAGLAPSLPVFLALRAVMGIGEASLFVAAATLVADLAPPHRRAEASSYFSVAVFGGIGIGPIIGEAVLDGDRFDLAFVVAAGFSALAALMSLRVPAHVHPAERSAPGGRPSWSWSSFVHRAAVGPGLVLASGIAAFAVFPAFLPDHAREIGLSGSGALFATYSGVCLVLRITGARLPERLGARTSVTIALTTVSLSLVLLAAVAEVWALWASAAVIGVGMAFLYPSLMALTVNRVDARDRPAAVSSFTMFFEIGSVTGGLLLGLVAELVGKRAGFLGGVVLCAAGLVLLRQRVAPAADDSVTRHDVPTGTDGVFIPVGGD